MRGGIIQVSPSYFHEDSIMGGGERYVHELCRLLAKAGEKVTMISFGKYRHQISMDGYYLEVFPSTHRLGFDIQNPGSVCFLSVLRGASVCHVHQISTMIGDLTCLYGALMGIPVFVTDHGGGGGRILHQRFPWIQRLYERAVGQSDYGTHRLLKGRPLELVRIKGGIDTERFSPLEKRASSEEFLFVGRLVDHKGVHLLLRAFRQLREAGRTARLRIVGRKFCSEYSELLEQESIGLPVVFEYESSDEEVIRYYQTCLAIVLPSITPLVQGEPGVSELMGFTPLEAQSCGTPVIVSTAGALAEFVVDGKTGWVFAEEDVDALYQCMDEALDSAEAMRDAARLNACQYSWDTVIEKHLELYGLK